MMKSDVCQEGQRNRAGTFGSLYRRQCANVRPVFAEGSSRRAFVVGGPASAKVRKPSAHVGVGSERKSGGQHGLAPDFCNVP